MFKWNNLRDIKVTFGVAGTSKPNGQLVRPDSQDVEAAKFDGPRSTEHTSWLLHMPVQEIQAQPVHCWQNLSSHNFS